MRPILALAILMSAAGLIAEASAQPADLPIPAATTDTYPPGVRVARTAGGMVYVNSDGRVLYGMDMRTVLRAGPDPSHYCTGACARYWEPLLAPATAQPNIRFPAGFVEQERTPTAPDRTFFTQANAPDWTIIAGPQGPQWVYKGWHLVFTRRGAAPGSTAFDGADERTWNTLKFVPPVPRIVAPRNVKPAFVEGRYVLVTTEGHTLFTGECKTGCAGWHPLRAGMASGPLGQWAVDTSGDTPQWTYRGKPVFVSEDEPTGNIPAAGQLLHP